MLEESLPAIMASVYGWFTPTVLFVLLNLVIGTIAFTSKATSSSSGDHPNASSPPPSEGGGLYRTSSLVLDRLRSFNLGRNRSADIPHPLESVPPPRSHVLETVPASPSPPAADERWEEEDRGDLHLERSQSDAHPTAGELPSKLPARMKKSASERSAFAHFEEADIVETPPPRPATTKAKPTAAVEAFGGDEVDARADDFINRFRHQLKLQRLDSIMRYKDMLQRGAATGS